MKTFTKNNNNMFILLYTKLFLFGSEFEVYFRLCDFWKAEFLKNYDNISITVHMVANVINLRIYFF